MVSSSPKSIFVKAGNQFSGYVTNFANNQKNKTKYRLRLF